MACLQLAQPVLAQLVAVLGREVLEVGHQHLALLAERAGDQGDLRALLDVAGHGRAVVDRLVVGVGVHQHQAPVGALRWCCGIGRGHGDTLRPSADIDRSGPTTAR